MTGLGIPPNLLGEGLLAHAFPASGPSRAEMPERVADGWHAAVAGIEHLPGMLPPVTRTGDGGFLARTPGQGPGDPDPAGARPPPGAAPASPVSVSAPLPPVVRAEAEAFLARMPGRGPGNPDNGLPKSSPGAGPASPASVSVMLPPVVRADSGAFMARAPGQAPGDPDAGLPKSSPGASPASPASASVTLPPVVHTDGGAFLMRTGAPLPGNSGAAPQQTPPDAEAQEPAARAVPAPPAAAQPASVPVPGTAQPTTPEPAAPGQPLASVPAAPVLSQAPAAALPLSPPSTPHEAQSTAASRMPPSAPSVPLSPQLPATPPQAALSSTPSPASANQAAAPPPVTAHESSLSAAMRSVLSEAGYARPPDTSQSLLPQMAHHGAALSPVLLAAPGLAFVPEALIAFRRARTQTEATLRRGRKRPPAEPELLAFPSEAGGAEILAFTDKRALPLDIDPAQPVVQCWRIDDTQALVLAGRDRDAAAHRAKSLHAVLMTGLRPLQAIGAGEGFATWLGSPLWLAVAGIAKPAGLGILLAESRPTRVEVLRTGERAWRVTHGRGGLAAVHDTMDAADPVLRRSVLYGAAVTDSEVLARGARLPVPQAWRVQEAWAAVQRVRSRAATREEADAANLIAEGQPGSRWEAMRRHGLDVLDQVRQGEVHGIGAADGLALALALGRLGPIRIALGGSA